ncbi:MAG: TolC family protein [Archangiaceae bacterium]|nr:TolC family protein [Archangiaceae bacterium]
MQAASARLDQAEAVVDTARAGLLPTVTAQGKYTRNSKQSSLEIADGTPGGPGPLATRTVVITDQNQLDGVFAVTAPLLAPAAWGAVSAARESQRAAQATRDATTVAVLVAVAQSFYQAAAADEALAARRHAVEVAHRTTTDAQTRIELGRATRVERTRAELAEVRAVQAEAEAVEARTRAYRLLATLLDRREPFTVAPPAPGAAERSAERGDRPDLLALQRTVSAQHAQAFASGLRWAPTLSAFGNLRGTSASGMSSEHAPWAVGLQLDWLIYDGGLRDAARRSAEASAHEAELRAELLEAQISDEVANAAARVKLSRTAIAASQRAVDLANESLELIRAQADSGRSTQLELLEAQDALVVAELSFTQSRLDLGLAETELRRAQGGLTP